MASSPEDSSTTTKTTPELEDARLKEEDSGHQKKNGRNGKHRFTRRVKTGCLTCKYGFDSAVHSPSY